MNKAGRRTMANLVRRLEDGTAGSCIRFPRCLVVSHGKELRGNVPGGKCETPR